MTRKKPTHNALPSATQLIYKAGGSVQLRDARDHVIWSSAADPLFIETFGAFVDPDDSEDDVSVFLVECGMLTEDQAEKLEVFDETLEKDRDDDDDDEDEDEDDDEDEDED